MSRPTMAGRKLLTVETEENGSLPAVSSPKGKGTTSPLGKAALSSPTSSEKLQLRPSTPLGAIPQESRRPVQSVAARSDGGEERRNKEEKQQEQEEEKRQEYGEDEGKAGEDHYPEVSPVVALDFEDRASSGMLNASMQQRIGKAFFQSLALTREAELAAHPAEEPLHKAIVSEELVDVAILLDELGPDGPSKIAARDRCGRTALHLAAMGNSAVVIESLLTCFRRTTHIELLQDLARLEADKNRILADVKTALLMKQGVTVSSSKSLSLFFSSSSSSFSSTNKDAKYLEASVEKHPRILAVKEWFFNESVRKQRQAEIRIEVWWAKLLATRDGFGRTALHYATARSAPVEVLSALCSSGRAELHATAKGVAAARAAIKTSLFDKLSVYDSASGLEIASFSGSAAPAAVVPSAAAQSKSDGGDDALSSGSGINLNASLGVHNIAYELGSSLGLAVDVPMPDKAAAESFEVVVPWVMRNVLKRATDKLAAEGFTGIAALERHIASTVSKPSATILVPEMRQTLALLGIRVTNEVLREMCRRYPADRDEVEDKWHKVNEEQAAEKKSIQQELIYLRRRAAARDRRGDGSKGDSSHSNAEEKGSSSSSSSSSSAKRGDDDDDHADSKRGKDDDENDDEDEDEGDKEGDRSKAKRGKGKGSVRFVPKEPKALTERRDRLLLMDATDKDKGIDFLLLLADIKNGRGLQSLDLKTMSVSGSDKKSLLSKGIEAVAGKDEAKLADLEELLLDTHVDQVGGPSLSSSSSHSRATSLVYPACVTVESMGKSRKAVLNTPDFFGRSPLMIASALGLKDQVGVLVRFGGDVSMCTGEGHSALSLARGASTRNVLEKALVQWLSQKDAGMVGSSERRLVEIKKTSSASFLDSLRGSAAAAAAAPGKQGDKGASAESQSSLAQRANVVSGLAAQLEQLSCKNWAYGRPPLSWAVNNGLVSVVKQSLNAGSDVNRSDALCRTPLHECAALISSTSLECHFEAAVEIVEVLLQAGADCNAASVSGRRPLHELFCRGQDDAVSFAKISLKSSSKKATPATAPCTKALFHVVSSASSQGTLQEYRRQLTKTLLGFGADPVLHDRQGMGAIHYCARENDAGCMLEILRRHCDVSKALTSRNQSALHVACKAGAKDVANLLVRWDADSRPSCGLLSQPDSQGKTPAQLLPPSMSAKVLETLWACARQGQVNKASDLLNAMKMSGAPLWEGSAADEGSGSGKGGGVAGAQELWLLDGIDAKSRKLRWTALHACLAGWAEREARSSSSSSAAGKPNLCARRALGLETSSAPSSPTRASAAAAGGGGNLFPETLQLLLNNSAFCDAMDAHCRTPLMLAAAANLVVAIDLLVAAGADVSARDLDGRTALHIANSFGAASAVSSLEAHGADPELKDSVGGKKPFELAGRPLGVPVFYP